MQSRPKPKAPCTRNELRYPIFAIKFCVMGDRQTPPIPDPLTASPVANALRLVNHCEGKVTEGEKTKAEPNPYKMP
ncbi:hypothetical protein G6F57_023594 [Rhizopus arrhizus]|nr:hypothetical protein G6F57_023594 [Rhizopus arrhizus]